MRSSYKRIGDFIQQVKVKNTDGKYDLLLGINIDKHFMPSVANIVGTDLTKYKVVHYNQFACNRMHIGRDNRIPLALSQSHDPFIVSPAYTVFEITDTSELYPEYLMMWFSRAEFDREAWFHTDADVRGGLPWDLFCDIEFPVPSIKKQREIVEEYNTIVNRIKLNEQLNQKIEETAQELYKHWFVDFEFPNEKGQPYKSSGGKLIYNEELDQEIPDGWEVSGLSSIAEYLNGTAMQKYPSNDNNNFTPVLKIRELNLGITDNKSDKASLNIPEKYKIKNGDIIFSWSGTLAIDIWTGGCAGLNQHLFKVSSTTFSKWFYYLSTKYYINEFIRIAEGNKTSMGHIKREHLDSAYVSYPKLNFQDDYDGFFNPLINKIERNKVENNILSSSKSLLLSKMSKVESLKIEQVS